MDIKVTVDDLYAAYLPLILSLPSRKPRDPFERELLGRLGDACVAREKDGLIRSAGERLTPQNSRIEP